VSVWAVSAYKRSYHEKRDAAQNPYETQRYKRGPIFISNHTSSIGIVPLPAAPSMWRCQIHRCPVKALCNATPGPGMMCTPYTARKWAPTPEIF
jgi:hypothetical protein